MDQASTLREETVSWLKQNRDWKLVFQTAVHVNSISPAETPFLRWWRVLRAGMSTAMSLRKVGEMGSASLQFRNTTGFKSPWLLLIQALPLLSTSRHRIMRFCPFLIHSRTIKSTRSILLSFQPDLYFDPLTQIVEGERCDSHLMI